MSISISRTCYFENKCPQTRMNTGFADSFAKYDTLRKKDAGIWKELHNLSSVTSCGCVL
mgnify:CR=1 FL=1